MAYILGTYIFIYGLYLKFGFEKVLKLQSPMATRPCSFRPKFDTELVSSCNEDYLYLKKCRIQIFMDSTQFACVIQSYEAAVSYMERTCDLQAKLSFAVRIEIFMKCNSVLTFDKYAFCL